MWFTESVLVLQSSSRFAARLAPLATHIAELDYVSRPGRDLFIGRAPWGVLRFQHLLTRVFTIMRITQGNYNHASNINTDNCTYGTVDRSYVNYCSRKRMMGSGEENPGRSNLSLKYVIFLIHLLLTSRVAKKTKVSTGFKFQPSSMTKFYICTFFAIKTNVSSNVFYVFFAS